MMKGIVEMDFILLFFPLILLFVLLILGIPIGISLGISGAIGLFVVGGMDALSGILQVTAFRTSANYLLISIPLFVLMAEFASNSSLGTEVFKGVRVWLGRIPGGVALATIFTSAGIGAISGSSSATAALMARTAIPEMNKLGYSEKFSLGTVSSAGTLAILIPPSMGFIFYGVVTEQSIGKLFIAGILPGIVQVIIFTLIIVLSIKFNPSLAPKTTRYPMSEKLNSLKNLWHITLIALLVIASIYSGALTVVETAAFGAIATLIISLFKGLTFSKIIDSLKNTIYVTSMLFTIIIGAMIFGKYLTLTQITQKLVTFITGLDVSRYFILIIILLIFLVLGFFMDQIAILVLVLPLVYPIVEALGFDLIWFGVIAVLTAEVGLITPPLGLNVIAATAATNTDLSVAYAGIWRYVFALLLLIAILIIFPDIATILPSLMR